MTKNMKKRNNFIFLLISIILMNVLIGCFDNTELEPLSQDKSYAKPYPTNSEKSDTLNLLNYYRKVAGLEALYYDETLSKNCKKHVEYMIINNTVTHFEDSNLSGYSPEGELAGKHSNIAYGTSGMYEAIEIWINSLYHRLPLLNPALKKIGFYYKDGYAVLDCATGINKEYIDWDYVLFPAPEQEDFKRYFNSREEPNPLPQGAKLPVGNFITITFNPSYNINENFKIKLLDYENNEVDIFIQYPTFSSDINFKYRKNTISILPKKILLPLSKYTVSIEGNVNDEYFLKKWDFFTDK